MGTLFFHRDRVGRIDGGVALYVRNTLNSYVKTTIKIDRKTESLWIEIIIGGEKFVVGIIYIGII